MLKNRIFFSIFAFVLLSVVTACGPKKPSVAELRQQKHVEDSLALLAQQRSLVYYDSLLQATLPLIDPMLKQFRYEKDDRYEDHGHYVHRLLKTEQNTARNYLQTYLQDDRNVIVKAYYYGSSALRLHSITISADSLQTTFTGPTHAFQSEGWHETLALEGDNALQLLHFIDAYSDRRIRISLVGERTKQVFYISDNDKKALLDTYQLGVLARDIHQLETQVRQTSLQIEKYQKRLQK